MSPTLGVIGVGRKGGPIVGHLVRKGFATQACNVNSEKQALVIAHGALWAAGPADLAVACDVTLVGVGFDAEVRSLFPKGGSLRSAKAGSLVAILSTIHPDTVKIWRTRSSIGVTR